MKATSKQFAIILGIISALFFAITFVLNRYMSVQGGHWVWSASLRYFWTALLLFFLVFFSNGLKQALISMKKNLIQWLLWSTIGFGLFYAPLTFASAFGPSWLIAGTWQITILAGMIVSPLLQKNSSGKPIPFQTFIFSLIILLGVIMMHADHSKTVKFKEFFFGFFPVLIAAFAYPLGNRKMMSITNGELNALQRTFGMTLASMPFWIILSLTGISFEIMPNISQVHATFWVAICSGVIATVLFFKATDKVQRNSKALAAVEATQSTEVIFALTGELLILNAGFPGDLALIGVFFVLIGMILHSIKK